MTDSTSGANRGRSTPRERVVVAVLVLQALTLLAVWGDRPGASVVPGGASAASGQIANAGDQRARQLDALDSIDRKLDRLLNVLEGGKLQVVVAGDGAADAPAMGAP